MLVCFTVEDWEYWGAELKKSFLQDLQTVVVDDILRLRKKTS